MSVGVEIPSYNLPATGRKDRGPFECSISLSDENLRVTARPVADCGGYVGLMVSVEVCQRDMSGGPRNCNVSPLGKCAVSIPKKNLDTSRLIRGCSDCKVQLPVTIEVSGEHFIQVLGHR